MLSVIAFLATLTGWTWADAFWAMAETTVGQDRKLGLGR
jgi:hypothetical protein